MHSAQERLRVVGQADFVLVAIAVVSMATARYFG
jgi:hypothetical protein